MRGRVAGPMMICMTAKSGERASRGGPPARSTPARRSGSIRRTTTHDTTRPEGFAGPLMVRAVGRDVVTAENGDAIVIDAAWLEAAVQHSNGTIVSIEANPTHAGLRELVGMGATAGFR